jgi:ribosomal-protein-alanine N-acetyltransferase
MNKELIGSVSINGLKLGHKAELGYWLDEAYWHQDIMTRAIKEIVEYAFRDLELKRLQARTFLFNPASRRVLEKNKFKTEGLMRKDTKKGNQYFNCYLLARVQ